MAGTDQYDFPDMGKDSGVKKWTPLELGRFLYRNKPADETIGAYITRVIDPKSLDERIDALHCYNLALKEAAEAVKS